jgi:signal transduction histidine kinase
MVNYTRDDLERRRLYWPDMTPPEFAAPDEHAQVEIQSGGVFSPYEKELLRKDGRRVPILIGGIVTQRHPDVHETVCLALDLSERRRSEERTKSIVEAGKILASSLEHEKTFPELAEYIVSKIADSCEIYIREGGELIRVVAIPTGDTAEDLRSELSRVQVTGKPFVRAAPASRVLVPITARGKIAGVLSVSSAKRGTFDIEDVRCLEACGRRAGLALEHSRLYYEMQKANRLKDEFLAIVSHELRTPLTPILGGIYMLRSEPRDRSVFARALDLIERNAKTQVQIVDDLLDVSRAMSGKLRLNMEPVDLAGVIQAAVETVWPASEAKGIQIDAKISTISGVILGDADRLQQVVWNLLSNSVKFTPKAGQVAVELVETSGQAEIRVIDTGIGIAAEFLPHVFEKFWQADSSRSRPHGGLGLGLAIVRYLVESHGGTVSAQSQGNEQGSSFIVRLPVRRAARASTG